jgi:hypothetical protein
MPGVEQVLVESVDREIVADLRPVLPDVPIDFAVHRRVVDPAVRGARGLLPAGVAVDAAFDGLPAQIPRQSDVRTVPIGRVSPLGLVDVVIVRDVERRWLVTELRVPIHDLGQRHVIGMGCCRRWRSAVGLAGP